MRTTTGTAAIATALAATVIDLTFAAAQVAPPAPVRLGERGQVILTSELALDYQRDVTTLAGEDDVTTTTYDFHVGFDRVVRRQITVGVRIGFDGQVEGEVSRKRFDLGARAGALLPLGGATTWWPTLGFDYGFTTYEDRAAAVNVKTVTLVISAPFLWRPARHVLLGLGPTYERDLQAKTGPDATDPPGPKVSGFGVHGLIGYWF